MNGADSQIPTFLTSLNPTDGSYATYHVVGGHVTLTQGAPPTGITPAGNSVTGDAIAADNTGTFNTAYDPGTINYPDAHTMQGTDPLNAILFRAAADQTASGTTILSGIYVQGTNVGTSSSGTGNQAGEAGLLGGACKNTLSGTNSCNGGNLYLAPGGFEGALTGIANVPVPGVGGLFTTYRKGNSGLMTSGNSGRLMCAAGTDAQGNANNNVADICSGANDYSAPAGFFVYNNAGKFINPSGQRVFVQVAVSVQGVQTKNAENWPALAPVCSDPNNPGYVTAPSSGYCFCPSKRVGTSRLADNSAVTSHSLDVHMGDACAQEVEVNGTPASSQAVVNFVDGPGIHISNPALGQIQITNTGGGGGGAYAWQLAAKTSNYNVTAADFATAPPTWFFTTSNAVTYTLPGAGNLPTGNSCVRISLLTSAGAVSINPNSIQLNGSTSTISLGASDSVEVCFDAGNSNYKMLGVSSGLSLPNGVTGTTQTSSDNSTLAATRTRLCRALPAAW